jgi:hypothetical protein
MRLKSRGLGRKELVMDFREYSVIREGEEAVIIGTIRDPVKWDFSIRVCQDDIVGMTKLILRPAMIGLLVRSIFRRLRPHHWTQDHAEHVSDGKKRHVSARQKAAERIRLREENGGQLPAEAGPARRRAQADTTT